MQTHSTLPHLIEQDTTFLYIVQRQSRSCFIVCAFPSLTRYRLIIILFGKNGIAVFYLQFNMVIARDDKVIIHVIATMMMMMMAMMMIIKLMFKVNWWKHVEAG